MIQLDEFVERLEAANKSKVLEFRPCDNEIEEKKSQELSIII